MRRIDGDILQIYSAQMPDLSPFAVSRHRPGKTQGPREFVAREAEVGFERILRIQGYADLTKVRPAIRQAAKAMAELAPRLNQPRVAFERVRITASEADRLTLCGDLTFRCNAFATILRGCTEACAFVLGLGPALDQRVIELSEAGDLLEALLLETAGWLCIEDATRQFKAHLKDEVGAQNMRITSRMGPGYSYRVGGEPCDWSLEEQSLLFSIFAGASLPVTLSSSNAMHPKMSRSGLFGIGPVSRESAARTSSLDDLVVATQ